MRRVSATRFAFSTNTTSTPTWCPASAGRDRSTSAIRPTAVRCPIPTPARNSRRSVNSSTMRPIPAASGNRPIVVLANLSGFDGSPESMRKLQLEYGAEIARAVVNFDGKLVFLVVSRYHGGAYVVFSRELNPNLRAFALEGSYASVIGGGPAAAVVFAREVRARVASDARIKGRAPART